MRASRDNLNRHRLAEIGLLALLLLCYGYTFPRWADPSQTSRLDTIVAVVEDHTFQIDRYIANTVDYAKVGDHYYSDKAPGIAFLGIPIYAGVREVLNLPWVERLTRRLEASPAFSQTLNPQGTGVQTAKVKLAIAQVILSFCLAVIPTLWIAALMFRLLIRWGFPLGIAAAMPLGYGLLTPAFAYANALYSHQLCTALCLAVFCWASSTSRPLSSRGFALAGFALAWAVISEYPTALLAAAVGLLALWRAGGRRALQGAAWMAAGALTPLAGWMAYNTALFGAPLAIGYGFSGNWGAEYQTGFMTLTYPHLEALWGVTFSPYRGLFLLSPVLLFGVVGFAAWWRSHEHKPAFWCALGGVAAMLLFNVSSIVWWGGFAVGPRYLLAVLPYLAISGTFLFQRAAWGWGFRLAVWVFTGWSSVAIWGLTLAGQAFPSDMIHNPLLEYAWPNWLAGNLARNLGVLIGLHGPLSLLPLALAVGLVALTWWAMDRRLTRNPSPVAVQSFSSH